MVESKTTALLFFKANNTMVEVFSKMNWEDETNFPLVFKNCGGMSALSFSRN
jgi:hypothetical protein